MTAISDFYEAIRFILDDNDDDIKTFTDDALLRGVRTVLKMGKIKGYTLGNDNISISPDLTNPNAFALVCYHVCKMSVDARPDRYSYRRRAVSESFGSWRNFLMSLENEIFHLENGVMFDGWQNFYSWMEGVSGVPLQQLYADLKINIPTITAHLNINV